MKPYFQGKAYIDPSNVVLDGSMQWWPLEVTPDQPYQDYPRGKSNQGNIHKFYSLIQHEF